MGKIAIRIICLSILLIILWVLIQNLYYNNKSKPYKDSPIIRTSTTVCGLSSGLFQFQEEKGYLPKSEEEFTKEIFFITMKEYLTTGNDIKDINSLFIPKRIGDNIYYVDAWGRPFKYIYVKDDQSNEESYLLYSCGKNGIDEKGEGDDIAASNSDYIYWAEKESRFMIDQEAKVSGVPTKEYRKTHPWPNEKKPDKNK